MKKIFLLFLIPFLIHESQAQVEASCDSVFTVCDSISIDSVFIIHPHNSHWLMIDVAVNHDFLYAPTFVVCPTSDGVQFVDDDMPFTGIFGPLTTSLHFTFLDFNFPPNYEISGNILVDNLNSNKANCQIPFSIIVNELTAANDSQLEESFEIFPNPAHDLLTVKLPNPNDHIRTIQLVNLAGIQQNVAVTGNTMEVGGLAPGYYLIHLELSNGKSITRKFIKE